MVTSSIVMSWLTLMPSSPVLIRHLLTDDPSAPVKPSLLLLKPLRGHVPEEALLRVGHRSARKERECGGDVVPRESP